jgi:pimeloyl-ACP methyl ester carboxylesterase
MGVYFLEAYDPHRIPVLFVHGAGGSPRHFQKLFDTLDRRRYQCWFYHYPTGMRLQKSARSLNHIVEGLHDRHRFAAMHVVAYSMGGLVSRSFILQNQENPEADYLRHYITISTPWNGHKLAALGVKHAPSVIPSWVDMQTNSEFIDDLLAQRLSPRIDHHLIFSFKGTNSMFLPSSNDGTVSLASQLDLRVQNQAVSRRGFNLDHIEIIADERLVECVTGILGGE